jgi:hypothetical protein
MANRWTCNKKDLMAAFKVASPKPFLVEDYDGGDQQVIQEAVVGESWDEQEVVTSLPPIRVSSTKAVTDRYREWNQNTSSWEYRHSGKPITKKQLIDTLRVMGKLPKEDA